MDFDVIDADGHDASCEADEPLLPQALAYLGEGQIVSASDVPHWDHSFPAPTTRVFSTA